MKIEHIGKRAMFLIPSIKVYNKKYSRSEQKIVKVIHDFLTDNYGGYTSISGNIHGYYRSEGTDEYDELRTYHVAINEADDENNLTKLQGFLAETCEDIDEECIYLEFGPEIMFVYPEKKAV